MSEQTESQDVVAERNQRRTRLQNELEDALDVLDTSDAFVRPVRTLVALATGKRAARAALACS